MLEFLANRIDNKNSGFKERVFIPTQPNRAPDDLLRPGDVVMITIDGKEEEFTILSYAPCKVFVMQGSLEAVSESGVLTATWTRHNRTCQMRR